VFEVFLPQLLLYLNPSDPLNGDAVALMMRDRPPYEQKVKGNQIVYYLFIMTPTTTNMEITKKCLNFHCILLSLVN
jgi:hypothetical protein